MNKLLKEKKLHVIRHVSRHIGNDKNPAKHFYALPPFNPTLMMMQFHKFFVSTTFRSECHASTCNFFANIFTYFLRKHTPFIICFWNQLVNTGDAPGNLFR